MVVIDVLPDNDAAQDALAALSALELPVADWPEMKADIVWGVIEGR